MNDPDLPAVHAFWIGGPLGAMHTACLKSFIRAGHRTLLHVYDDPGDAPRLARMKAPAWTFIHGPRSSLSSSAIRKMAKG